MIHVVGSWHDGGFLFEMWNAAKTTSNAIDFRASKIGRQMEYFSATWQDYHPIFVGAGCLALGYMYGRHCRSVVENHQARNVTMALDVTGNLVTGRAALEKERRAAVQGPASYSSDSALNYSNGRIDVAPEKCGKRAVGQLEIFQTPRKKEDALWAQSGAFKRQKGVPVITIQRKEPIIQPTAEPAYDSDDEILARRLEYFINRSASISKPGGSKRALKLGRKKKKKQLKTRTTAEVATMSSKGKDLITTDSLKSLSKTSTRFRSGLCDLANLQGERSLEDTCRSPKTTVCFENSVHLQETNSARTVAVTEPVQCAEASEMKYDVSNPVEGYIGDDSVGLMDLRDDLNDDSDHTMGEQDEEESLGHDGEERLGHDEEERLDNVWMKDGIACEGEDAVVVENSEEKVPSSPPTEFNVQDRSQGEVEREGEKEHEVPMDTVLKVEIYELLHAADCAKVSFEEIVSLLEEKLKVVLREDKAHFVSLVREVISISQLLEEEKALEGSEQVEAVHNVSC